jgi:NAD(P)-dependent dehydrogenase (short-subunit alcohol dehydrogenase family)
MSPVARLEGRVAVVTGGASGMGRDTALRFAAEGARVVIGDVNEGNGAATLEAAAEAGHADAMAFRTCDVAVEDDVAALVNHAVEQFGRLDVMFNNAGVPGAIGPITETTVEDWDYTLSIMLTGVMTGTKHAARQMIAQGEGGSIINTASVAGVGGGCGPHAYSAAKAAVINLTNTTAAELAAHRIRVNAICPGAINTPLINFGNAEAMGALFDGVQPWPRHGTGDDIAALVAFLASDEAGFITGEHIVIDGGLMARGPGLVQSMSGGALTNVTGVGRGTTGQPSDIRPLDPLDASGPPNR